MDALNMHPVQLAQELCRTTIKLNSANPGFTQSALNGITGTQPAEVGAIAATRPALRMTMAQLSSPSQRTLPFPGPVFALMQADNHQQVHAPYRRAKSRSQVFDVKSFGKRALPRSRQLRVECAAQ